MSSKIKDEENHNASDDDSSGCSSHESMCMTHNEDGTGTETKENGTGTCTIDTTPKSLVRSNDTGADLKDSNDGVSTSEGSIPKLLIRKEHVD